MPPAKKLKSSSTTRSTAKAKTSAPRAAATDLAGDSEFARLAKQHWLKQTKRTTAVKVKNDVLKTGIWDSLEREGFAFQSLLTLESLQILERCASLPGLGPPLEDALTATARAATSGLATRTTPRTTTSSSSS